MQRMTGMPHTWLCNVRETRPPGSYHLTQEQTPWVGMLCVPGEGGCFRQQGGMETTGRKEEKLSRAAEWGH